MKTAQKMASNVKMRESWLHAELVANIAQKIGMAESLVTAVPNLLLFRRTAPSEAWSGTYEPGLAVVVQGRKRVELGPNTFFYDRSRFLLTSVDLPVVSRIVEASEKVPYLCMRVRLEMPMVRELLHHEDFHSFLEPESHRPAMTTAALSVEFLDALRRLVALLDKPEDIAFLSPLIQREIVYRILRSPEGRRLRAIATTGDQSQRTAKVIAWIRANFAQSIRVEDLADIAGMGTSTLHHHFRVLTSMSPLQYQKQLRLQTARQRMFVDGVDAASAAFEVGYESASQFNREYSRFFGQPPGRDVRAVRAPGAMPIEAVSR